MDIYKSKSKTYAISCSLFPGCQVSAVASCIAKTWNWGNWRARRDESLALKRIDATKPTQMCPSEGPKRAFSRQKNVLPGADAKRNTLPPDDPYYRLVCLRVEFLLKTDSEYPKDTGVDKPWQPLRIPFLFVGNVIKKNSIFFWLCSC